MTDITQEMIDSVPSFAGLTVTTLGDGRMSEDTLTNDVKRQVVNTLIREQIGLRYSLEVQHNVYGNLKSERAKQICANIEAQMLECNAVIDGLQAELDALNS